MASQLGYPASVTQLTPGAVWTNPTNISVADGTYATTSPTASQTSETLVAESFGFSVPAGSSIAGVELAAKRLCSAGRITDSTVQIFKGISSGANKASGTAWSTSLTIATYGSSSDLWGLTFTPTDVNASNFGLSFAVSASSLGGDTASVDYISLTVYYSAAASSGAILLCQMRTAPVRPQVAGRRRWPQLHKIL